MDPKIKELLESTRQELEREISKAASPGQLVIGPIERPAPLNLWDLSEHELDQEMGSRLSSLNEDINTRPEGPIASHRRLIGPLIVFAKRIQRWLRKPFTNLLLSRQVHFNEQLVAFHLASFIRFRQLETKLTALQEKVTQIEKNLERLGLPAGPEEDKPGPL